MSGDNPRGTLSVPARHATQDPAALDSALLHSVEEKARDSRETNARFFAIKPAFWSPRRRRSPTCYRRGGRMFPWAMAARAAMPPMLRSNSCIRSPPDGPALAAINLVADLAMISAVGNDVGFEHVFVRQMIAQAKAGDGLIGISTSGNSSNLIAAFAKAKEMGLVTIGLRRRRRRQDEVERRAATIVWWCRRRRSTAPRNATSRPITSFGIWCTRSLADDRGSATAKGAAA